MDDITKQKKEMWTKKLAQLEKDLADAFIRKGEAAQMGDLRENAAYQEAINDIEVCQSRIPEVKKILEQLENQPGGNKAPKVA